MRQTDNSVVDSGAISISKSNPNLIQALLIMRGFRNAIIVILLVSWLLLFGPAPRGSAQGIGGAWSDFVNIAHTPNASTYPTIAADQGGNVHVLWSEDVGGQTSNPIFNPDGTPRLDSRGHQLNRLINNGKALFYTRWDGGKWLDPIDVQFDPGLIEWPQAVVDPGGTLHVVWVGGGVPSKLFYSQAPAAKAESAREWSKPVVLAQPVLYAYYPVDIKTDSLGGLHILYSQLGDQAGAYVRNSTDGGATWSKPIALYATTDPNGGQEGVSPVRLTTDAKGRLHATWSRFGEDGNGKAIFYAQSQDQGKTWSSPFEVATWHPGWYEVDWLSVGVVGDEIYLVWEGSSPIAPLNERVSHDGGLTWGEPYQILPKLQGENGFSDLVTDSAGRLHMLVVQRGDSAYFTHGIWYTTWEQGRWLDPVLLGTPYDSLYSMLDSLAGIQMPDMMRGTFTGGGLRYQRSAIVSGNILMTVVVNEWDGDLWSSHTTLDAPLISPRPFPLLTPTPASTPTQAPEARPTANPGFQGKLQDIPPNTNVNAGSLVLLGALPGAVIVGIVLIYRVYANRSWR